MCETLLVSYLTIRVGEKREEKQISLFHKLKF